ncbi:transcriptional regulator [Amycolatopsis sp. YIM 10]|uniref:transcriptional regulator n=1 Tax=Amycolatopsis sp. YIM 10 TaxID=2653857 RepID=UPI00128FE5C4|nr:transcriptional regulator [Amycolatopsis sp. YIM 10]QFU85534.1 hypothetical protein YIM_01520 [Amycolatopsis sp. YIM 10]
MTKDYGRPPRADENRALIERRLAEVVKAGGPRETLSVDWRGGQRLHLEVIQFPAGDLYYNPATHRVQAQRSHDPDQDRLFSEDPWGAKSQEYLDFLLKAQPANPAMVDPEFEKLMEDLKEHGQNQPGLITADGVLVDGNTRRAALLALRGPSENMRVAVLPETSGWNDIRDVELSLQLRKEHRREYSYINQLLAIDELAAQGMPVETIAATFRIKVPTCKRDQWVLSCIRSMIERSEARGVKLPLVAFEDQTEKLRELHRRYVKESAVNPDKAELLLESRLAAIMLGKSKTDVRFIEPDFQDRYLTRQLPADLMPTAGKSSAVEIPGLGRVVKGPSEALATAKALTDTILQTRAVASATSSITEQEKTEAVQKAKTLQSAMDKALDFAGRDERIRKRKQAAPERLDQATQMIDQCVTDVVMARSSRSLDDEALDEEILKLRKSLRKLALEAKKSTTEPGDGLGWLLDAVMLES